MSSNDEQHRLPSEKIMTKICQLAIDDDKPILLDYWKDSIDKIAFVGIKENGEKLLVKSKDEYTSTIIQMLKGPSELVLVTENSIYIVALDIKSGQIKI
jgi:hypothetical protein